MPRVDEVDVPLLRQLEEEHDWFRLERVIGRGLERTITGKLKVEAYAWQTGHDEPELRSGEWMVSFVLARGMAVQPLVLVAPDDEGYLPAGGNISDWTPHCGSGECELVLPGAICYADRWHPRFTLAWLAHQVARILVGEVAHFEAQPLSRRGRDFQAAALAEGKLPTQVISVPRPELLYLEARGAEVNPKPCEITFHDISV